MFSKGSGLLSRLESSIRNKRKHPNTVTIDVDDHVDVRELDLTHAHASLQDCRSKRATTTTVVSTSNHIVVSDEDRSNSSSDDVRIVRMRPTPHPVAHTYATTPPHPSVNDMIEFLPAWRSPSFAHLAIPHMMLHNLQLWSQRLFGWVDYYGRTSLQMLTQQKKAMSLSSHAPYETGMSAATQSILSQTISSALRTPPTSQSTILNTVSTSSNRIPTLKTMMRVPRSHAHCLPTICIAFANNGLGITSAIAHVHAHTKAAIHPFPHASQLVAVAPIRTIDFSILLEGAQSTLHSVLIDNVMRDLPPHLAHRLRAEDGKAKGPLLSVLHVIGLLYTMDATPTYLGVPTLQLMVWEQLDALFDFIATVDEIRVSTNASDTSASSGSLASLAANRLMKIWGVTQRQSDVDVQHIVVMPQANSYWLRVLKRGISKLYHADATPAVSTASLKSPHNPSYAPATARPVTTHTPLQSSPPMRSHVWTWHAPTRQEFTQWIDAIRSLSNPPPYIRTFDTISTADMSKLLYSAWDNVSHNFASLCKQCEFWAIQSPHPNLQVPDSKDITILPTAACSKPILTLAQAHQSCKLVSHSDAQCDLFDACHAVLEQPIFDGWFSTKCMCDDSSVDTVDVANMIHATATTALYQSEWNHTTLYGNGLSQCRRVCDWYVMLDVVRNVKYSYACDSNTVKQTMDMLALGVLQAMATTTTIHRQCESTNTVTTLRNGLKYHARDPRYNALPTPMNIVFREADPSIKKMRVYRRWMKLIQHSVKWLVREDRRDLDDVSKTIPLTHGAITCYAHPAEILSMMPQCVDGLTPVARLVLDVDQWRGVHADLATCYEHEFVRCGGANVFLRLPNVQRDQCAMLYKALRPKQKSP